MRSSVFLRTAIALVVLTASPAFAQDAGNSLSDLKGDWGGIQQPTGLKNLMLIDPARLTVSHSVSMSYGMGSAYGSDRSSVQGMFLNHLNYRLSNSTYLWADVGVGFQPTMGMDGDGSAQLVLPGFGLLYQPSENFRFEVIVQNPNYYYNPYRYWRR
jgi:hypothetical protein